MAEPPANLWDSRETVMTGSPANLWDGRDDRDDRITREPVGDVGGYDGSERVGSVVDGLPDTTLSLPS